VALAERAWVVFDLMRSCYLENNRWPTEAEIQSQCSLSAEEIRTISNYYQDTHSLDAGLSEDNPEQTLMDTLSQQQFVQPLNELISNNLNLFVTQVVATLTEKEAAILNMRFGLKNHSAMTLQAIADHLHVTRERVRQIQNQALYKLKQQFGYELLPFLEANDN
jgi:RNA polymerase primary sigma factor